MKKLVQSLFLMLLITTSVLAQDKRVSGKVTAKDDGMPLPGVSIKVSGTNIGTQTNVDGNYSITVPLNSKTIEVSYVGFTTEKISVGTNTVINVSLASDAKSLSEVLVNGIANIKRNAPNTFKIFTRLIVIGLIRSFTSSSVLQGSFTSSISSG